MSITQPHPASPRLVPSLALFGLSLLPGLLAFLPGVSRALWNFTDPVQQTYLTPFRVALLSFLLVAVFAPFIGAAVALVVVRVRARSWARAFTTAAVWAAILGGFAFFTVMVTSGGF
jgi:hypothetical protein